MRVNQIKAAPCMSNPIRDACADPIRYVAAQWRDYGCHNRQGNEQQGGLQRIVSKNTLQIEHDQEIHREEGKRLEHRREYREVINAVAEQG